ncbi:MAG: hypothetical protein OQJ96_03950 [Flavobacteriales bacterium]|nr:hypothetical protein [Flavobacteriales bacterium]MCW8912512.1 hypothetical protein [Flavobacteriales bacterium]MCW8936596.1 hypothetical protein [Flavobacteriales bacterium]MCW8940677.1 hypothetical protein [Flavobacteriales bacterium]MCW8969154.1 hypothetical protein [Flavobacteriales bacterium]
MSNINRHNYEAFLLDYLEQNLSPNMVAELMVFLEQHPDLKQELDELQAFEVLEPNSVLFDNKATLKKEALDNLMIAEIEGINTSQETKTLKHILKADKTAKNDFKLFQQTKLKSKKVIFKDKEALKKEAVIIPLRWFKNAAAAVIIMTILIQGIDDGSTIDNQFQMATFNPVPITKEVFTIKETTHKPTTSTTQPIKLKSKKIIEENTTITPDEKLNTTEQLAVNHITEKDSIVILPTVLKKEEKVLANNTKEQAPVLTIGGFLKKEATKKILQEETTNTKQPLEIVVADLAAKVAGKKGGMKKNKNDEGEVKEYALSIGKFSISKKVKN